jgi:hypothetical protein
MNKRIVKYLISVISIIILSFAMGCFLAPQKDEEPPPDRLSAIPEDAVKLYPEDDLFPPILHSNEWEEPIPMPGPINTAGGEDSAFITPDGKNFYVFFTPDVSKGAELQVTDGVTGIYWSRKEGQEWTVPERVLLQDRNKLSLDGCLFVQGDMMWFCSVREGNRREIDIYIARLIDGKWKDWENAGKLLNVDYGIGELHITADGNELFFHAIKDGGFGEMDIWVCKKVDGVWQPPINVQEVNTSGNEGWPFVSEDGSQLWITRRYNGYPGLFRSFRNPDGRWTEPELIVSQFAGEATLDNEGNLYFTHHFYKDAVMLDADIYVAYKK